MSSKIPMVTIAVLSFNNLDIIDGCIKSIAKIKYPRVECMLIDDCSSDNTAQHVRNKYPWVKVIEKPYNSGIGTSRNIAIANSSGKYILFHDSDAQLFPDYLDSSIELMERDPTIAVIGSKLLSMNDHSLLDQAGGAYYKLGFGKDRGKGLSSDLFNDQEEVFFAGGAAQLVRMDVFKKIGNYDVTTGTYGAEDVDICWRARLAGYKIIYNPKSTGMHGYHTTVRKLPSSSVLFHSQKAQIRMMIKNFGWQNLVIYIPASAVLSLGDIVLFPEARMAKVKAWVWNIMNIRSTILERRNVQRLRKVRDKEIDPYFAHDLRRIVVAKFATFYGKK